MSQFLPEVKMDFIPSDDEDDEDEELIVDEEIDEETGEENPNFKYEKESIVPEIIKKGGDMNVNDIFNMPNDPTVKLTKKGKPRKKRAPMSEEHKEKLKGAREKALEVRRRNANEKKEMTNLKKEEKELIKKSQINKVNKLKQEVGVGIEIQELQETFKDKKVPKEPKEERITKKDLEDAQLEAIIKYEIIRKQRKKEKQDRLQHEKEAANVRQTLMRAVAPTANYQTNNPYGNCY